MLRVDPDESRPALIGSVWERRQPEGDPFDRIVVRGLHDNGVDFGGHELVISPESFGPALTCTPESLAESYRRAGDSDNVDRVRDSLRALEARVSA